LHLGSMAQAMVQGIQTIIRSCITGAWLIQKQATKQATHACGHAQPRVAPIAQHASASLQGTHLLP